jgi:hypothetical protein
MLLFVYFPFVLLTSAYIAWWAYKTFLSKKGKDIITVDTHVAVPKWRSILLTHTYIGAFIPCHYKCAIAHGLLALQHVALLGLFLSIFFLYFDPTTTEHSAIFVSICAIAPHVVRPLLYWGFQYSKFSESAIEQARRNELLEAAAVQSEKDFGSWRQYQGDFVNGNALEALDQIELEKGGTVSSGKALRLDIDDDFGGDFGPSSETKIDPLADDRSGNPTVQTRTPNVFDNGELDDLVQEDFAFVGLFQPERNTPAPRPGRGAMDAGRGGSSRGGSQGGGTRGRGHLDIFDFNDFDDAASYASSRRSSAASFDDQSIENELSPAQQEAKKREEDAALFMFGHLAKREGDDEQEPSRASRARVKKSNRSKDPKERSRAKRASSIASSDAGGGGSLKELWQQSSLRTSTMTGANQFDDWVPAKSHGTGGGAASAGGHSSPISTASPYSAPSPRRGGRHRHKQDDLFDDYYGGNYGSEEYEVSSAGESIPTVATAGNSLDEDEKGLPVPVTTLHHIFYPITLASMIAFLAIDYVLAKRINEQEKCDSYQNAMAIALAIDFVVVQNICVGLTYLFRYMNSEEEGDDEKDDGFYSELHPYEGEIREYFGLGDPTEGLKRNASTSGFGGTHTTASMASLRKAAYRPESENEHVHEWF